MELIKDNTFIICNTNGWRGFRTTIIYNGKKFWANENDKLKGARRTWTFHIWNQQIIKQSLITKNGTLWSAYLILRMEFKTIAGGHHRQKWIVNQKEIQIWHLFIACGVTSICHAIKETSFWNPLYLIANGEFHRISSWSIWSTQK